jgi:hypothetical protein
MGHVSETDRPARMVPVAGRRGSQAGRVARAVGGLVALALVLVVGFAVIWVFLNLWLEVAARGIPRVALSVVVGAT